MKVLVGLALALAVVIAGFVIYDLNETNSEEVANQIEDSWDATREFATDGIEEFTDEVEFSQRDSFFEKVEARIDELKEKINENAGEANEEMREELAELEASLENAREATAEEWDEASAELKRVYNRAVYAE